MLIILNGISPRRNKFYRTILPVLESEFKLSVEETKYAGHAGLIATTASLRGEKVILAAGGDGTISQVINGVVSSGVAEFPTIGLIPLGSGNDLARTLELKSDLGNMVDLIRKNQPKDVDVGVVDLNDEHGNTTRRFFINECSIGMGPEVVRRIEGSKSLGASITYIKAIITTFFTHKPQPVELRTAEMQWTGDARVLAIANGKAFGHSIYIAPDADISDGMLNLFLCTDIPLMKFLFYLQVIKKPKKVEKLKWISYRLEKMVEVSSKDRLPVEADGELIGFTPFRCSVAGKRMRFLC